MRISDWSSDVCSSDLALLGVFGQREERLEHTVGVVDQRLRDAVVADAGKTPLAVGRAEFVDEGLSVLRAGRMGESADVECGDSGRHARALAWIGCSGYRSLRPANADRKRHRLNFSTQCASRLPS